MFLCVFNICPSLFTLPLRPLTPSLPLSIRASFVPVPQCVVTSDLTWVQSYGIKNTTAGCHQTRRCVCACPRARVSGPPSVSASFRWFCQPLAHENPNGKSISDSRETFHAHILPSCHREKGRGQSCQSCDMAFVSFYQSFRESGQKVGSPERFCAQWRQTHTRVWDGVSRAHNGRFKRNRTACYGQNMEPNQYQFIHSFIYSIFSVLKTLYNLGSSYLSIFRKPQLLISI